jgi:hypothetical protein
MKMDPAAARIPTHTYRTMITDNAIWKSWGAEGLNVSSRELGKNQEC